MTATSSASEYVSDILDQPARLRALQDSRPWEAVDPIAGGRGSYDRIVLTGMGASLFALWPAWLALVQVGEAAWIMETGQLVHHAAGLVTDRTLVIAASQSGRSAELVTLGESAARGGTLVALTNDVSSPLADHADLTIPIDAGQEHAVSTRSYVNTLATAIRIAELWTATEPAASLDVAADAIEDYLATWRERVDRMKDSVGLPQRMFLTGRGRSMAAANCGALILKEAAKWPVEALSAGQFRHGPLELADARMTAVILAGEVADDRDRNRRLLGDVKHYGGRSVWVDADPVEGGATIQIAARNGLAGALAEIVGLQLLSIAIAEQAGIEPGVFRHLEKVTTVE